MSKQIIFETINPEEQKNKVQFESKIMYNINGKMEYPEEETGWIYQDFSGFAPKRFIEDPAKRDYIKYKIDPGQTACMELKKNLLKNDEEFEVNRKMIFGKFDRLYKFLPSIKPPKSKDADEEELSEDENEVETTTPAPKNVYESQNWDNAKMKLKMDWFYYYNDKRLDKNNTSIIKKNVFELLKNTKTANLDKDKTKAAISSLPIKLTFKGKDDEKETIDVLMKDIEQRKEIDTKIFYRKPDKLEQEVKKPFDCNEEELVQLYGDPMDPKDIRTPDDLDLYYRNNSYVRFLYKPLLLWASKDKMPGADKRTCGIKYIIHQIDIIQLPYENTNTSSQKMIYSKYAFGKKNILINQSADTVFNSINTSLDISFDEKEQLTTSKSDTIQKNEVVISKSESIEKIIKVDSESIEKIIKVDSESIEKIIKVDSESDESDSEESVESVESEESESETEVEVEVEVEEVKVKSKKNIKTVVETVVEPVKNIKINKKTK
jgi:hypothetical protein